MSIYEDIITYVDEAFKGKQKAHFERAVYWLEQFLPECTEAHRVAAYSHDIERAFRDPDFPKPKSYLDMNYLRHHEEEGARIMEAFLTERGQTEDFIQTVTHLISRHEEGGDHEQNMLRDADSVSFQETNAEMFVTKKLPEEGREVVVEKLTWTYERIGSEEAKMIAKPLYDKCMKELD